MNVPEYRPPYRAALVVMGVVLAVYVLTLAPTVTFWDAGEFIAAAKTLGIPHPPGTPLFVMIAHVWAMLIPAGEFALRTNLLSAVLSAAESFCTMAGGVPFGAKTPCHTPSSNPLRPASSAVGRSGNDFSRALVVTA